MKYIVFPKDEITKDMLSLINQGEVTVPSKLYIEEPDFENGITGIASSYLYITTEETFPNGFSKYKKFRLPLKNSGTINYDSKNKDLIKADAYIENYIYSGHKPITEPFTSKVLSDGRKLYKRTHGVQKVLSSEDSDYIELIVPYTMAKINAIEIIGAEIGNKADFTVYDTLTGAISGVPNYTLNQFGFNVNLRPVYHKEESSYDADVFKDMRLVVTIKGGSNLLIGVNFILHEVK